LETVFCMHHFLSEKSISHHPSMLSNEDVTTIWISEELAKVEGSLAKNELALASINDSGGIHRPIETSPLGTLLDLQDTVECLELSKDVAKFLEANAGDSDTLMNDVKRCEQLAILLCRHLPSPPSASHGRLLHALYTQEYIPLFQYCRCKLIILLRRYLRNLGYPSANACAQIIAECKSFQTDQDSVASCCYWLSRIPSRHSKVKSHMSGSKTPQDSSLDVVLELCRPIIEKVRFHFLEASDDRISSTKSDRLPEWVFNYLREHAFEGGPWSMIEEGLAPIILDGDIASFQYLDQIARLGHFVLEQRNFFRNEAIVANPTLLSGGIEQILRFDAYLTGFLPRRPFGLAQSLVAEDEDVWAWWLDRERESYLSLLFDAPISAGTVGISPRAELFCAIIHSLQAKASLFVVASTYIAHVGVPICQHFLDAIHESATDLKNLLNQRKLVSPEELEQILLQWIELINGTKAAATKLVIGTPTQGLGTASVDHDLARVGRSLERLVDVLVNECATSIVETVLMERAKLASYLMRCSHVLMTLDPEEPHGLSTDLQDTATIYSKVMEVCTIPLRGDDALDTDLGFAPAFIQTNVTNRLADKFLEVVLDAHGMTPEIRVDGAKVFARDMEGLFGSTDKQSLAMRLLDVSRFMMMETRPMSDLKMALLGLTHSFGEVNMLDFTVFSHDGTLMDEGTYMLRAKGFSFLHLEDAVSILNRRRS
jgi:hypothetical protein